MAESLIATICVAICEQLESDTDVYSTHHGIQQLARPTPTRAEIRYMMCDDDPQVIERWAGDPNDVRGDKASFLVGGIMTDGRIGHTLCMWPPDSFVITAWWPAETQPEKWVDAEFKIRRT